MSARPEIAFVIQRYGRAVTGGSEALARAVAARLASDHDVTVLTTQALDYVTWRNELPAEETLDGVRVRRFPVEEERDLAAFNALSDTLYDRPHTAADEEAWLRRQGPFAPALVEALGREKARFRAIFFFTYLYYPTVAGLRAAPERSILVPTTHDEPPLRLGLYRETFALPRAFAFLTPPEAELVRARFEVGGRPSAVAGIGVDQPAAADGDAFRARYGLTAGPYLLYAGRIDAGKGCAEMLDFYRAYREQSARPLPLVLIGALNMPLGAAPGVVSLGYLPEADKAAAIGGADVVICPSAYESLSIVLLEAMAAGVPTLSSARSAVLLDHSRRSGGGLYYATAEEFAAVLERLQGDRVLHRALGESGRSYVSENYRWPAVMQRYRRLIDAVAE